MFTRTLRREGGRWLFLWARHIEFSKLQEKEMLIVARTLCRVTNLSLHLHHELALVLLGCPHLSRIDFPSFSSSLKHTALSSRSPRRKTAQLIGDQNIRAPMELEQHDFKHIATVVLSRPKRKFFFEAIVLFSCLYLSFAHGIFYMFFQSYPIIYEDTYGLTGGQDGLTFFAIGVGAYLAFLAYLGWDLVLRRACAQNKIWVQKEGMRRLPLACIAGPFSS